MKKGVLLAIMTALAMTSFGCGQKTEQVSGTDTENSSLAETSDTEQEAESELDTDEAIGQMFEALQPGYYIVSSIGRDGDVEFYNSIDAANGYLRLNEDNTGVLMLENEEESLTWEEYTITCDDEIISGYTMSSPESEVDTMVLLYYMDTGVSVILYPAEE